MLLMIIAVLVVLGLCFGSFANALVWRVHEQADQAAKKKPDKKYLKQLSVAQGRSMCPNCKHELAAKDLVPVLSWLALGGKCRYCSKPISVQYPLVEVALASLFVVSYLYWPMFFGGAQTVVFILWLALLTGLTALLVYDVRWFLLPNRFIYPLGVIAVAQAVVSITAAGQPSTALLNTVLGVIAGGSIFYLLFQVSGGKWIGGGDVKLGWLLGLVAASPARSLLLIFVASAGGSLVSVPFLISGRMKRTSLIPFGPFLIIAVIIVQLFGAGIIHWYRQTFITF
jgi:prepilin signal peptidase PulO-like enzyme (type II secretory pathway)